MTMHVSISMPRTRAEAEAKLELLRDHVTRSPQGLAISAVQDQAAAQMAEALKACDLDLADPAQAHAFSMGALVSMMTYEANAEARDLVTVVLGAMVLRVTEGLRPPVAP